jgi:hypothetical protein
VQDRDAQQAGRLAEVDQPGDVRMLENRLRPADVGLHRNHPRGGGLSRIVAR